MLLGEGGYAVELTLFGHRVEPRSKTTFYFSITVLVRVDRIDSRYQRKLAVQRQRTHRQREFIRKGLSFAFFAEVRPGGGLGSTGQVNDHDTCCSIWPKFLTSRWLSCAGTMCRRTQRFSN